jgi:hypothetical protein
MHGARGSGAHGRCRGRHDEERRGENGLGFAQQQEGIRTMLRCGCGGTNGGRRSESVGGVVSLGSAGMRAERRGRLLSLVRHT